MKVRKKQIAAVLIFLMLVGSGVAYLTLTSRQELDDFTTACSKWEGCSENPILEAGSEGEWDDNVVSDAAYIKVGDTFYMYYSGNSNDGIYAIGLATSSDGKNFTKITAGIDGTSKVLERNVNLSHETKFVWSPAIIYHNGTFYLFYTARNTADEECVCLATSSDGKNFTKYGSNPVLAPPKDSSWEGRARCHPDVIWDGTQWVMLYTGATYPPTTEDIGRATSPDLYDWTTDDVNNPVIAHAESWEGDIVGYAAIYPEKINNKW